MRRSTILGLLAIAGAAGGVILLQRHAERARARAIAAMAPDERAAMVAATRGALGALCADPALAESCEAHVQLLLMLPECDGACRAEATRHLPQATR